VTTIKCKKMETRNLSVGVAAIIDKLLESSGVSRPTPVRFKQGAARVLPENETTKAGKARIRANSTHVVSSASTSSPITAELARPAMPASVIKERAVAKSRKGMLVTQAQKAARKAAIAPVYTIADRISFACYDLMVACENNNDVVSALESLAYLDNGRCVVWAQDSNDGQIVSHHTFINNAATEARAAIVASERAARRAAIGVPVTRKEKEEARVAREYFYDRMLEIAIAKFRHELNEAGVSPSEINFLQRSFVESFKVLFWHNGVEPVKENKVVASSTRGPVAPVVDNTPKVRTYVIDNSAVKAAKETGFVVEERTLVVHHKTVTRQLKEVRITRKGKVNKKQRLINVITRTSDVVGSVFVVVTNQRAMLRSIAGEFVKLESNQQLVAKK